MKALVLMEPGRLVYKEWPLRQPDDNELLIKTEAATICTSDLNDIKYNPFGICTPMVMGHEGAGIVAAIGSKVQGFAIGDRVAAHPVMACGECQSCKRGLFHLCQNMNHLGINREGVFAEYFCVRADRVRKIPSFMDYGTASLMEPVSVCLEGVKRGNVKSGNRVLVIGDGPFGIITCQLLQTFSPVQIILIGRHWFRMKKAKGVYLIHEKECPDVNAQVMELTEGNGVDCAILCAGTSEAVNLAISCLRPRGTLSVFSAVPGMPGIDLFHVHVKELNICGSCNDENQLDQAIEFLSNRNLNLGNLITHRIPFPQWERAFALAEKGKDEALKVTLTFEEEMNL